MNRIKIFKLLIINGVLLLLFAVSLIGLLNLKGLLQSQRAAERYAGQSGERYAQITCFFQQGEGLSETNIRSFEESLDSKLQEASLEATEDRSLWVDAYSMKGTLTVKGFRGSVTASATGVGGAFFQFHPLRLRSGSYIDSRDLMRDRVVLDEELAWKLFGSYDVAGMEVSIGGRPYFIAGVIDREDDFASARTYSDGPGIFVSYQTLENAGDALFTCYEVILPDPISGFAKSLVTDSFQDPNIEIIQNNGRFELGKIWSLISGFGDRSIQSSGIAYPYWENAARVVEDYMALLFILTVLIGLCPFICLSAVIVMLLRKLRGKRAIVLERLGNMKEKITQRHRNRKNTNK